MVVIKESNAQNLVPVIATPLTPESFAPFGSVISADHQVANVASSSANQGTAVKIHKVAPITNNYANAPSGQVATANWNIFRCSPPKHLLSTDKTGESRYLSKVLERHPFSTQTFLPLGRSKEKTAFLVICAETDKRTGLPDESRVHAFTCKGNQSVTYGVGTWHAPMVALGDEPHLDFAVLIHENGVDKEDCEEVVYENPINVVFSESQS
ncbi:unnamed protein product [Kuraishia capsulata CBS 1993]|uniref:Ureidoglycolate lyase n=1 Tax=Kuraishia capsulata CBS 1993 TaxID=1382522 RepID=W6MY20_9ASCO|nr:uncharacterized protein KUCA_T00005864001 [Kuraishia capsulata CBS 1993]CDK29870.1 unnamed protein product [Kuraishia capsulata CBS 1993]